MSVDYCMYIIQSTVDNIGECEDYPWEGTITSAVDALIEHCEMLIPSNKDEIIKLVRKVCIKFEVYRYPKDSIDKCNRLIEILNK